MDSINQVTRMGVKFGLGLEARLGAKKEVQLDPYKK